MAWDVVNTYAEAMQGLHPANLSNLVHEFWSTNARLNDFAIPLIETIRELGISPVLVSGAPMVVVEHIAERIDIDDCFGLELGFDSNGSYDGSVAMNLAISSSKQIIVDRLMKQGKKVALSFGDTISDVPIFKAAQLSYVITKSETEEEVKKDLSNMTNSECCTFVPQSDVREMLGGLRVTWINKLEL